jgi:hypothetical protein
MWLYLNIQGAAECAHLLNRRHSLPASSQGQVVYIYIYIYIPTGGILVQDGMVVIADLNYPNVKL